MQRLVLIMMAAGLLTAGNAHAQDPPGLTDFASGDHIVVIRQQGAGTIRLPFNYHKVASGSEADNFFVRAGDIIFVP